MLTGLLITLNILVCIALVGVVLMQRSEGGAFGTGGSPTGLITARGAGDLLTRTTWILFGVFLALSLALTLLGAHDRATSSIVEKLKLQTANPNALVHKTPPTQGAPQPAPQTPAPSAFSAPLPQNAPGAFAPPAPQPSAPGLRAQTGAAPGHAAAARAKAKPEAKPAAAAPTPPVLIAPPPQPAPTAAPAPQPAPASKSDPNASAPAGQP